MDGAKFALCLGGDRNPSGVEFCLCQRPWREGVLQQTVWDVYGGGTIVEEALMGPPLCFLHMLSLD